MFYQILLSQQVKQWAIVTYKRGMHELPHELPNDLRLRILGNLGSPDPSKLNFCYNLRNSETFHTDLTKNQSN